MQNNMTKAVRKLDEAIKYLRAMPNSRVAILWADHFDEDKKTVQLLAEREDDPNHA